MAKKKEKKRRKKKRKLTSKEKKLIKAVLNPEIDTVAEAARIAGYAHRQTAHRTLQKSTIQTALQVFINKLESHGVTDHVLARRLAEGLHTKRFSQFGKVIGLDRKIIGDYIDKVLKIKQYVIGGSREPSVDNRKQLVIVIGNGEDKRETAKEILEEII